MCKKCEQWLNTDEDYAVPVGNSLALDCGALGKIESEIEFAKSTDELPHRLVHWLYPKEMDGMEYQVIEINYCPFCGRKLSKESE